MWLSIFLRLKWLNFITLKKINLPRDLTISEMYRLFLKFCEEESYEKVNFDFYERVLWHKFCHKFEKPKKDGCNTLPIKYLK